MKPHVPRWQSQAEAVSFRFWHYYAIPAVKRNVRALSYVLYILLFSHVTVTPQLSQDVALQLVNGQPPGAGDEGGGR